MVKMSTEKNEFLILRALDTGNLDSIKKAHEAGCDFNQPFKRGLYSHPVAYCCILSDEIFSYVLENTDPDVVKNATIKDAYDNPLSLVHVLARRGCSKKLEMALDTGYFNIEEKDFQGYSLLTSAVAYHSWKTAEMLIKRGADISTQVKEEPLVDILAQRKKDFIKGNMYYSDLDPKDMGKTGDPHTGEVTQYHKEIARAHTDVAKVIALANSNKKNR